MFNNEKQNPFQIVGVWL